MSELHLTVEGYVREVGDLGIGKKGPAGRGIKIEMADGTDDVVITGLTINQCRAAAQDIGKKIIVDFRTQPGGAVNPTRQHQEFCGALRGMPCICNATPLETSAEPEVYKGMKDAPAWIDDGAGGLVNLGMALSKIGIAKPDKCANCGHSAKSHAADNGYCACGSCICFIPFTMNRTAETK